MLWHIIIGLLAFNIGFVAGGTWGAWGRKGSDHG